MRRSALGICALVLGIAAVAVVGSGALGDSCDQALVYQGGTVNGELQGDGLWYRFDAQETGQVGFSARFPGTKLIAGLVAFSTCDGAEMASAQGSAERPGAQIVVDVTAGQSYYLRVSNLSGEEATAAFARAGEQVCGDVAAGDCYYASGTPACDDFCNYDDPSDPNDGPFGPCPGCCETVCAADSFCCSVAWDGLCAMAAASSCQVIPVELMSFRVE